MYNRYIPQPDGSYRRNQVQEPPAPPQRPMHREPPRAPRPEPVPQSVPEPPRQAPPCPHIRQSRPYTPPQSRPPVQKEPGIGGFLRQLLPKNLDTEDLLIILLLLLMSGDCAEDQNTALLTLAIYLFL